MSWSHLLYYHLIELHLHAPVWSIFAFIFNHSLFLGGGINDFENYFRDIQQLFVEMYIGYSYLHFITVMKNVKYTISLIIIYTKQVNSSKIVSSV